MESRTRLCSHLADAAAADAPFKVDRLLAEYEGPIDAVVRCRECEAPGLIQMVDWEPPRFELRLYALSGLRPHELDVFVRNTRSSSCDVARYGAEVEALIACAGRAERLLAYDLRARSIAAAEPYPEGRSAPDGDWRERLPADADDALFRALGLRKGSAATVEFDRR